MSRHRRQKGEFALPTSFLDKLLILILVFLAIAILALILINPIVKKKDIETKAEFMIDMEWVQGDNDIDLWVEDPIGNILSFRRQEAGMLNLDRDDTGNQRDFFEVDGKKIKVLSNHETITVRGIMPGIYVVNIHLFRASGYTRTYVAINKPVMVKLKLTKVNPKATTKFEIEVPLTHTKEERHIVSFEVNGDGEVVDVRTDRGHTLVYAESNSGGFFNNGTGVPINVPQSSRTSDQRGVGGFGPSGDFPE